MACFCWEAGFNHKGVSLNRSTPVRLEQVKALPAARHPRGQHLSPASAADRVIKPRMDGATGTPAEERVPSAICDPLPLPPPPSGMEPISYHHKSFPARTAPRGRPALIGSHGFFISPSCSTLGSLPSRPSPFHQT